MRPVEVMELPISPPHVCAVCGVHYDRDHYVDLGVDTIFTFANTDTGAVSHWIDGVIYFCNLCMDSLITAYASRLEVFKTAKAKIEAEKQKREVLELRQKLQEKEESLAIAQINSEFEGAIEIVEEEVEEEDGRDFEPTAGDSETAESDDIEVERDDSATEHSDNEYSGDERDSASLQLAELGSGINFA